MHRTEWIFFDLGSTLVDETGVYEIRIRETVAGTNVAVSQFAAAMRRFSEQGLDGYRQACAFFHLKKTPWPCRDERLYDGCADVLNALKQRGYRLGVIANQVPGTEQRLRNWDLLQYFDVLAPSAELGMEKPDPAIFLWALEQAGCAPLDAAMIGDRIDNDILPAKALGMKAIRIRTGPAAVYRPDPDPADITVDSLFELLQLF